MSESNERMSAMSNQNKVKQHTFLLHLDGTEIAKLIREKQISSVEVTQTFITHIKQVNPQLNAVVEERFSLALEEAAEKDAKINQVNFARQPLYGVPISVKESFHVIGMKTTAGLFHRKDVIKNRDAEVVRKLKKAGAIVLCKTNTPPLCFCHETENKLYGRTNNGWNHKRSASGSSGGEAALISVGGSPLGISSDIGGSIRFPSHFNGVIGFKPGMFQVSSDGHIPADNIPIKSRMSSIGPIGKSVRDMELVNQLTASTQKNRSLYEKMRVEILPNDNGYPLSDETAAMMDNVYACVDKEYDTTYSLPPYFNDSAALWQEMMSIDGGKEIKKLAYNTDRANVWKDYMREKMTGKSNTHIYLSWAILGANMFKPSAKRVKEIERIIDEGDRVLESYLHNRLLVFPVYYRGALKHGEMYKEIFSLNKSFLKFMPYTAYANVWGLPALTIPTGFDHNQMPIGIQIIGKVGNEDSIFKLGTLLESHFGGYIRSTYYDA